MLSVDIQQKRSHVSHFSSRHCLSVDAGCSTGGGNLTCENHLIIVRLNLQRTKSLPLLVGAYGKNSLHQTFCIFVTKRILLNLAAKGQVQRTKDDGLTRSGLTGQDV